MNTVQKIAVALGETELGPLRMITRVIKVLGEERARALLAQTQQIETEGGMITDDSSQCRTPGGVYFKLVKNQTTPRERWVIFSLVWAAASKTESQVLTWEECAALVNEVLKSTKGEATTVKLTLIGRPGRVIEKVSWSSPAWRAARFRRYPQSYHNPPVSQ